MKFTAYYRVSTNKQGQSGLGLEAQKESVRRYVTGKGEAVPPPFIEVESGKNNDRPVLKQAIAHCKANGTTLLIAKIDRLSRNAAFILMLKDELESAGVKFVACDMPEANTLTIGMLAVIAQAEREAISKRTKAALKAKKDRGEQLGTPENLTPAAMAKGHATIAKMARQDKSVRHAYHFIAPLRDKGLSFAKIAAELNAEGYTTRKGGQFYAAQVKRIYDRLKG